MAKIKRYTIPPLKPLSAAAQAGLADDARFLRKASTMRPERCAITHSGERWCCDYCDLLRHGGRPECKMGLAA
jgi:hypothetical protein